MDRSPRAEALSLMNLDVSIPMPELSGIELNSEEAGLVIDSTTEVRFVLLARVIDKMLGHAQEHKRPLSPRVVSPPVDVSELWEVVNSSWQEELYESALAITDTPEYIEHNEFSGRLGELVKDVYIDPLTQLDSGISTLANTNLILLKNMPAILDYHGEPTGEDNLLSIARHPATLTLTRTLAKLGIYQLAAAEYALSAIHTLHWHQDRDIELNPSHFRLITHVDDSQSLGYDSFDKIEVPRNYSPRSSVPPLITDTPVREVPGQSKVIGCPITLLNGRLGEMWKWSVDLVEANDLWRSD